MSPTASSDRIIMEKGSSASAALLLPILLILCSCASGAPSAPPNATHENFVQCFSKTTKIAPNKLSSIIFAPRNPSFTTVLKATIRNRRFDTPTTRKPSLIVAPTDFPQVQATVLCGKAAGNILIKIRSGGHDYEGLSYVANDAVPFIILDMFNLRDVRVNAKAQTAYVQAGATLGELYFKISEQSKVHGFPAGVCHTVGVGGHLSGAGYGTMLRKYGTTADNVVDAEIVTADGKVLNRKTMGEDLFWAINGGGGASFGVILSYTVKLVPVPPTVTVFRVEKSVENGATDAVFKWLNVADKIDNDLFIRLLVQPVTGKGKSGSKTIRATFMALFLGDSKRLLSIVGKDFPELGLAQKDCLEMSWIQSALWWGNFESTEKPTALLNRTDDSNFLKRKSDYLQNPIPKPALEALWQKMSELGKIGLVFNPYGGKMAEIPAGATPFPHRAGNICKIQYSVNWDDKEGDAGTEKYLAQARALYDFTAPLVSKNPRAAYLNYRDLDIGVTHNGKGNFAEASVYGRKYFLGNFDRLVKVKTAVDPTNFFRNEQSIPVQA